MDAMGRLAGGIAHDFNNILTAIVGYADLLGASLDGADPRAADVEEIRRVAERAASLTRRLLDFSRRQVIEPRVVAPGELIAGMHGMLRRLIGENIDVSTGVVEALWAVKADPAQLEHVLVNLVVNARDAMPSGGALAIETANVTLSPDDPRRPAEAPPGDYAMISVRDTGVGFSEESKAHLFEPFFTTKPPGEGTGLGLATCYGIVRQSGGFIAIASERGRGTTASVFLPRTDEAPQPAADAPGARDAGGTETVLVAEDDPTVRAMAVRVLRDRGYTPLEATDGDEALRVLLRHPGGVDLLLTDVVMPNRGGRDLARHVAELRPGVRILYVSGYLHDEELEAGAAFLQKPFSAAALVSKVRETLDAAPPAR
jgi:CheY-like chemotaxis protein